MLHRVSHRKKERTRTQLRKKTKINNLAREISKQFSGKNFRDFLVKVAKLLIEKSEKAKIQVTSLLERKTR